MRPFRDLPIARKALTLGLVPTVSALLVASVASLTSTYFTARRNQIVDVESQATVVADNIAAGLSRIKVLAGLDIAWAVADVGCGSGVLAIAAYALFLMLNIRGLALSFRVTVIVTLLALGCLVVFWIAAIPRIEFARWALDIGAGSRHLPEGHGPFLPNGWPGAFASMPFAVWLYLAIEQIPLAAEESADPKRDMPKGIMLGMFTLIALGFLVLIINPDCRVVAGAIAAMHAELGRPC